jgi:hypothetical protein
MNELPPGFVIDGDHPPLPPGFTIDGASNVNVLEDVAKSGGIGVAKGVLQGIGAGGDVRNLASAGVDYATNKLGLSPDTAETIKRTASTIAKTTPLAALTVAPSSADLQHGVEGYTGKFYEPKTEAGKVAELGGELVPGAVTAAATGGGSLAGNLVRYAAIPAVATRAAENYIPESSWKPYLTAAAGIGSTLVNPARVITPLESSAARQAAVRTLADEGVTSLTAGQITGNKSLQYLESAASHAPGAGGGASRVEHEGQRQFTEAAARRAGAGPDITPEVLAANQRRLGQSFQDLSGRNNLVPDNQFVNDVVDAARNYRRVPDSQQRQMVQGYIDDIVEHVNNGHMPGPEYQEMRSRLSRQANSLRQSDPTLSEALRDMRNALDNAMNRSISPADREAWQATRAQYGAQKVLEKAASRAGEVTAEGQITPANLRNTIASENRGAYSRGEGDFNDLARSGVQVMTPLPNSGTAQRMNAFHLLNAGMLGIPQALAGRAIMSPPVQAYLANQLANGALPNSPAARQLLAAQLLIGTQRTPQIEQAR